jgi:DNA ligase-1
MTTRREFLQLAYNYDPNKHSIGGWYASEKLDGMRAYWDGGWTRGKLTSEIPFANTLKDFRRVTPPYSTGLWSRYAKPIAAPDWWLDELPDFPLDGELYLGPGRFQELISTVKRFEPIDRDWENVEYRVFDLPPDYSFLAPGKINNPQWTAIFDDMRDLPPVRKYGVMNFHKVNRMVELGKIRLTGPAIWETQVKLPMQTDTAEANIDILLDHIVSKGGEGVVLRKPESIWTPQRTWDLLKLKPWHDSEALVTGFVWGKGKLEGLFGSMIVEWRGKTFELSGFTDAERELYHFGTDRRTSGTPGEQVPPTVGSKLFPKGSVITFRYRELTNDGLPKEARYFRS